MWSMNSNRWTSIFKKRGASVHCPGPLQSSEHLMISIKGKSHWMSSKLYSTRKAAANKQSISKYSFDRNESQWTNNESGFVLIYIFLCVYFSCLWIQKSYKTLKSTVYALHKIPYNYLSHIFYMPFKVRHFLEITYWWVHLLRNKSKMIYR